MKKANLPNLIGFAASVFLLLLSVQRFVPIQLDLIEAIAAIASAWSVWLLAKNNPLGWWIGLIGVIAYAAVFYQVKLYGEVAIQFFYLITSLQAIYIWLRGGENSAEKPVCRISQRWLIFTGVLVTVGVFGLRTVLISLGGAAPFWDTMTTILSAIAQLYLMERYLESWYLWIVADTIYVPLYASRGLYLTSILYAIFWLMAIHGLQNFQRIYSEQKLKQQQSL
ncbi:nicotinamide mononucleotide transporter [Tychonema sp. LEGE 07199]|uniref:nicotinamide riboside transporter PnuC n=1 Tax=unclassified Tychonema TaxID=2642144 RepID=UPI00187E2857|nr:MULTISPECIES: nicotinamide riboside transporter PnuC [unclassified Tychonema]MBE9119635.1 nicotinamide mononucleotide transporter [Tychonema sp. LEGE 07199]MBE9132236.1 nicotinamide mononucleotide transporter [Tychonema sp. LEGE 07196]